MSSFGEALASGDVEAATATLAEDVIFRSPVTFGTRAGREAVAPIIRAVASVFENFRYTNEYRRPDGRAEALQFEARIGDHAVEGCDFLALNAEGEVQELVVMVRPMSAVISLAEAMRAVLDPAS